MKWTPQIYEWAEADMDALPDRQWWLVDSMIGRLGESKDLPTSQNAWGRFDLEVDGVLFELLLQPPELGILRVHVLDPIALQDRTLLGTPAPLDPDDDK